MQIHPLISDSDTLAQFCARISSSPYITVDTEFMRENTYYSQLCLVQIADEHEAAAIDPLANGIDLSPMLELLTDNHDVLKIFHAAGQDIEIFVNMTGKAPFPMFDTQIAAMALGQGDQIGYSNLVDLWLNIQIDKGARFTDWARRPLDKRQIDYAIADVTHLSKLFPMMLKKLQETKRGKWLNDEMEKISNAEQYVNIPDEMWHKIKIRSRAPDVLGRLRALAAWREHEAQQKNIPRGRVVKDETLADIAVHPPRQQADLGRVRGLSASWKSNDIGMRMMQAIADSNALTKDEMPDNRRSSGNGRDGALVADLLKLLLKIRSREINVASRLITKADELEQLAAGEREGLALLEGWRYEQFGKDALDLVEGRLAFAVVDGKLKMTLTADASSETNIATDADIL